MRTLLTFLSLHIPTSPSLVTECSCVLPHPGLVRRWPQIQKPAVLEPQSTLYESSARACVYVQDHLARQQIQINTTIEVLGGPRFLEIGEGPSLQVLFGRSYSTAELRKRKYR
ncbi:hypothetical protein BJX66DRAFT_61330 [Aspergillus keveii]|uniref:Secreted protein n=1 Tax=Aspergillus keveii TaxID=714993 RepID=A0ABR4FPX4_9EURO